MNPVFAESAEAAPSHDAFVGQAGGCGLHVLRLTPHFYWPQLEAVGWPVKFDAIGGMQTQIYEQTRALAEAGISQSVITLKIPGAPALWKMTPRTVVRGVRVPLLPMRSRVRGMVDLNLSWLMGVLLALKSVAPRPDVIHVHWSGVGIPPLLSWAMACLGDVPVVATVHCSSLATYHPMSLFDVPRNGVARAIERAALEAIAKIVVLTPRIATMLTAEMPKLAGRIAVIPDALDCEKFTASVSPAAAEALRREFSLHAARPIVGYVGRVAREKGWRTFLDVAAAMGADDVQFIVCGDGNERDLMEHEIDRRGLRDRVTVTGYLPHWKVAQAISVCDVIVLTSQHEEFGSILLEAMAVGVPTVAFAVGGVPHVLDEGRAGVLVPDGDVARMVAETRDLLGSRARRDSIRQSAWRYLSANFGRASATSKVLDIYQTTLSGHRSRHGH